MGIAVAVVLLVAGGMFAFSAEANPNTTMLGIILMVVGGFSLVPSIPLARSARNRPVRTARLVRSTSFDD